MRRMSNPSRQAPKSPLELIQVHFGGLTDPRMDRTRVHDLMNILVIALCATLGGADNWEEVEEFGWAKLAFFRSFLDLPPDPEAIPSHDTFSRVFAALDAAALERCLVNWMTALAEDLAGEVVAIDGKTIRRSLDRRAGKKPLHLVSAWASETGLALGQIATQEKSNEITAIPQLVEMLDLAGATVTLDALGCQKEIAAKILEKQADYVLAVKENQPKLHEDVQRIMDEARQRGDARGCSHHETTEKGHGRIETRKVWSTASAGRLWQGEAPTEWAGLQSVILVESSRTVDGRTTVERRHYISSRRGTEACDAKHLGHVIRRHWGIENSLHWVLDMAFDEDRCRVRLGEGGRNLATLRKIALNLLKQTVTKKKMSLTGKRRRAGWDEKFLLQILKGEI
jgi:predicted transposase YbfD/YdcC